MGHIVPWGHMILVGPYEMIITFEANNEQGIHLSRYKLSINMPVKNDYSNECEVSKLVYQIYKIPILCNRMFKQWVNILHDCVNENPRYLDLTYNIYN